MGSVEENLFTCSQDAQVNMTKNIEEHNLNRVVVAACTPITHEPLFRETLIDAGLNKYLFEMANIRNQDSWVHMKEQDQATAKAKDLVRMAVARASLLKPLMEKPLTINQRAVVLGGGVARSADLLIEPILGRLQGVVPFVPRLVASSLGRRAATMGAIMLVLHATTGYVVAQSLS